jgi:hypothetical protein
MFTFIKRWFKKPEPTGEPVTIEWDTFQSPSAPSKYGRATHNLYYEIVFQNDLKGRRAVVRFYRYDNSVKPEEVVVEDSNQATLEMKVGRLIEQRMSKGKRQ